MASLPRAWVQGCDAAVFAKAHAAYESPGRFYHSWRHVVACLETLRGFPCESPRTVCLSLVFHDAVYVPGRGDNEDLSAALAVETLRAHSTLPEEEIDLVRRAIVATKHHRAAAGEPVDVLAVLDIDMSILGAAPDSYDEYAAGVRKEYCPAVVTQAGFVSGRIAFLEGVLASPRIFHTAEACSRWEAPARANIARELGQLKAGMT